MNFHLELRKSSCRKELKRRTGRSLDILEVRRHELVIGRSPTWAPCHIRYYPAVGRMLISGARSGQADTVLARLTQLFTQDAQVALDQLIDSIEPLLAAFLTLAVGVTLLAVMLPLIGILGSIG